MESLMSLEAQAEKALSTFKSDSRPRKGGRMRYRMEVLLVLLWGMYRGWDNQSIAYQTGTHYQTGWATGAGCLIAPAKYSSALSYVT